MAGRHLTPAEARAWAAVTRTVKRMSGAESRTEVSPAKPVSGTPEAVPATPAPAPSGKGNAGRHGAPHGPRAPGPSGQRVPSAGIADRGSERRVRRGQVPFTARFDLHGHSQASADGALRQFISHQRRAGARCVLIITGKGRAGESVLKRNFLAWANSRDGRANISGIAEAHPRHGGSGAFYVWLRRTETPR